MDLHVTISAVGILSILVVLRPGRLFSSYPVRGTVARQAKLPNPAGDQQAWIGGTVGRMARNAAFRLDGRVLIDERALFIGVTLDTSRVSTCCQPCLFKFEAAMRIVTIAATHRAFQDLMVKRKIKLMLHFRMATQA